MTKEERRLLLVDLSARFPYNVAVDCRDEVSRFTCYLTSDMLREIQNHTYYWEYKPYLFPMSSMTDEQEDELIKLMAKDWHGMYYHTHDSIDWLNAHHFDYRGLIPMDLAIDATGLFIY